MKKTIIIFTLLSSVITTAQAIKGTLKQQIGQQISLTGFNYYETIELAKDTIDAAGNFTLNYPKNYKGMGILKTQDKSKLVFVLTKPDINLTGNHLLETDSLQFTNSYENKNFMQYAKQQGLRGNALSALEFLLPLYKNTPLLATQKKFLKTITKEQIRLQKEDDSFVSNLDNNSYVRWFIPYRKLVQEMPIIVRKKTEQIPQAITQFRNIDFNHPNFKTSGLFKEVIEGHYLLLENMGQSLDSMYVQMNLSSQYLIDNLKNNDSLLNIVSSKLFKYLEKRSLYKASEYLSLSLLNNNQCSLTDDLAAKLESYRKMKVGNIAPDILLENNTKLSDLKSNKLVVFGASWCPTCKKDALELLKHYDAWQTKNLNIIYISIDTDEKAFKLAYANTPWQMYCDFNGWNTQAAKDYHVTGTPSYFLLDKNNKIIKRPVSVKHADVLINHHKL
ncbi:peroxiredoxin family protein [Thalassobellus citreus]|uniref:peroxiredoxin family protein n=1 Tax=Thalassobellus citreus TaxID=3367752 RepID=UPI0037BD78B0